MRLTFDANLNLFHNNAEKHARGFDAFPIMKAPFATAKAILRIDAVRQFVCLSVCLSVTKIRT